MKLIYHLLYIVPVALGIPALETCVPEIQLDQKCNVCSCSDDGWSCKKHQCPAGEYDKAGRFLGPNAKKESEHSLHDETMPVTDVLKCKAGSVFMDSCNTCICNQKGTAAICTGMNCLDDSFNPHSNRYKRSTGDDDFKCTPGETYRDNCNTCICDKSGKSGFCDLKLCDAFSDTTPEKKVKRNLDVKLEINCEPRSTFLDDCNHCICSENGDYAICTAIACASVDFGARIKKTRDNSS